MCELGEKIGEAEQLVLGFMNFSLYFNQGESLRGLELADGVFELAGATQDAGLLARSSGLAGSMALFLREVARGRFGCWRRYSSAWMPYRVRRHHT